MKSESLATLLRKNRAQEPAIDQLAPEAVDLAADLLQAASRGITSAEKAQQAKIAAMMEDPKGKLLTMALSDQAFRSHTPGRVADQIRHLLERYGMPRYFAGWEQAALHLANFTSQYMPQLVVPLVVARLRSETKSVILPSEDKELREYLALRRQTGTRLNLNQLGEAILGEGEAHRRLEAYARLLARPEVEYISVKISSIFSQIQLVDFRGTVDKIKTRLRFLYRHAMAHRFVPSAGGSIPKFVNLDMEEYRDLQLTVVSFREVLEEEEFHSLPAGIVLQAYLPDCSPVQQELTEWAMERTRKGGAPIKIRLVKGANLAMEKVEASWQGWPQAPYGSKADVDANFKRMVLYGFDPCRVISARLGIASHNLFDIAFALLLRAYRGLEKDVEIEMLEGMANHQARAVQEAADGLLLYAPVVRREDFHSAIGYLVRRLDENTAPENFLHDLFGLQPGDARWERQKSYFLEAVRRRDEAPIGPQRTQNRSTEKPVFLLEEEFRNEPDTDFSLLANQEWATMLVHEWKSQSIRDVPIQIAGRKIKTDAWVDGKDPSRPTVLAYRYCLAGPEQVEEALAVSTNAVSAWSSRTPAQRAAVLTGAAESLAASRATLIGAAILDGGKALTEADTEVSEAIDFANYYARALGDEFFANGTCRLEPYGTVVIAPPWNFPIAIPCGGILAALMAGNTVILKPAPETVLVAWELCQALWKGGIPTDILHFLPVPETTLGQKFLSDERVGAVILTGAYETARLFLGWKPEMRLLAETSGKNALIVSAMADHDQAIKDLVKSAFGHNGQKCSAASLAILEAEVYDNPIFLRQLKDAAASLQVGSAWDLSSKITPLIRPPGADLHRALTTLEQGEEWLLRPETRSGQDNLWSPGIKLGVRLGSWFHRTECFGPVLGLMRAKNLTEAITIANDNAFGLTGGLHSLDDREITRWLELVQVGNAYINRGITGAIVRRQPFGGWKRSAFGGGAKAGGPNYVASLGVWQETADGGELETAVPPPSVHRFLKLLSGHYDESLVARAEEVAGHYAHAWETHFSREHDPNNILGEKNIFRYRPPGNGILLRLEVDSGEDAAVRSVLAALTCGAALQISAPVGCEIADALAMSAECPILHEDEAALCQRLPEIRCERVRCLTRPSKRLLAAANDAHRQVVYDPVLRHGRLELRHYLREQAVSWTIHRYGNLPG